MERSSNLLVSSPNVKYTDDYIFADYDYEETLVTKKGDDLVAKPFKTSLCLRTGRKVGKLGIMLVGWGGNNGSTFTAAVLANRHQLSWNTKNGTMQSNWLGSITQASTVRLGMDEKGHDVYVPMSHLLPMVHPDDLALDGWDISPLNLAESMVRAKVIDYDLQQKLRKEMAAMKPRPAIYDPDFIAANQADRATHLIRGTKYEQYLQIRADIKDFKDRQKLDKVIVLWTANTERTSRTARSWIKSSCCGPPTHEQYLPLRADIKDFKDRQKLDKVIVLWTANTERGRKDEQYLQIRADIKDFKDRQKLDKVIVLWTANTERFCEVKPGVHDTSDNIEKALRNNEPEISPSTIFALAAIDEGCCYINGSPQNTLVEGVVERAEKNGVFVAGDDFKSGQTKLKSVLVDFLVSAGLKPVSIVSYNHLGNNDGKNLSSAKQFRSKEISKSNVVDDMVESNSMMYKPGEKPDHVVVIKYVPYVGDSKRAMDEYTSEILLHGTNTIVVHNTCEDSLLAVPLILDLALLAELFSRLSLRRQGTEGEPHMTSTPPRSFSTAPTLSWCTTRARTRCWRYHLSWTWRCWPSCSPGCLCAGRGLKYTSEILLYGTNTIVVHNTCKDSLLAVPLILDLALLAELFSRLSLRRQGTEEWSGLHCVLSSLSYLLKAPVVPAGAPVMNALFKQRAALENILRAALGLPPLHQLQLEHKVPFLMSDLRSGRMFAGGAPPSKKQKVAHTNGDK
ncbi:uncharacterized protein LOC134797352 [Cydia splendana]|uniref:uncharacterized protein LOC134797352 n=1 Tax=Cydia splendana TaxID=1100963 RepID=UPI00300D2EA2